MRCHSLLEFAIGFVAHLYCVAFWIQSEATKWSTYADDVPRAWVHRG
jgi:hypothetical protein